MSGLSRTPGKRVWANPHRGFESRPLRHECKSPCEANLRKGFFASYGCACPTTRLLDASGHRGCKSSHIASAT